MSTQLIATEKDRAKKIKELREELKALRGPSKPATAQQNAAKALNSVCLDELLSISKVSKLVRRHLRDIDAETFRDTYLNEKQLPKFNVNQFTQLCKSPTLVIKCMTGSQYAKFIDGSRSITPRGFLSIIKKASCFSATTFNKRKFNK